MTRAFLTIMIRFHTEEMVTTFPRMPCSLMVNTFPGLWGSWIFSGFWRKTELKFHISKHRSIADFCYITDGYQCWLPLINAHIQFSAYWRTLFNTKHFFQLALGSGSFNTQTVWLMLWISLTEWTVGEPRCIQLRRCHATQMLKY